MEPRARSGGGALEGDEIARSLVDLLVDRQAEDVVLLDLAALAAFADYFVIATATSDRQMAALVDAVADGAPGQRIHREGDAAGGWVLLEVGVVVVHLFSREQRAYYDLEGLWQRAHEVVRVQ
ncbi:MAG: ribosome silencing factor [Chloroflexi bacterium]|nr:ribosome silencing factor [Chloroflexota bacterium]